MGFFKCRVKENLERDSYEVIFYSDQDFFATVEISVKKEIISKDDVNSGKKRLPVSFIPREIFEAYAPAVMAELVRIGIPCGTETERDLEATKKHLEDMRKLTFKLVEREREGL